jgi:uncharacterized peroxidase-related enzyme
MWYVQPIGDENVEPALREVYDQDIEKDGYVWNTSRVWSHRPEMIDLWMPLMKTVRSHLRLRTYELTTIAAAHAIGCVYCMLAHGAVLRKNGFTARQVISILEDYHNAGLSPEEVHLMDYASKISRDSRSISQADIDLLRQDGLNEQQITDIALAAVLRNFISRFFDALGAGPDPELIEKEPELWSYLKDWGKETDRRHPESVKKQRFSVASVPKS